MDLRRGVQDAGEAVRGCLVATLEGLEVIMANAKAAPGLSTVPPDTRIAIKCRITYCSCLIISLLGGIGSDVAEDLCESFRATLAELGTLAADAPSDIDGDTPRARVAQVDSKLQMLSSAVQEDCDVSEVLEAEPDLAAASSALVRAVLERVAALDFPPDLAALTALVREERTRMNAVAGGAAGGGAPRSSITPLASAVQEPPLPPAALGAATAPDAGSTARRDPGAAAGARASLASSVATLGAVGLEPESATPRAPPAVFRRPPGAAAPAPGPGGAPAAGGLAAAGVAASARDAPPVTVTTARESGVRKSVGSGGGAGSSSAAGPPGVVGLLHQRRLAAVAVLTGIQQLADVQASPQRIIHAAQVR